MRPIRVRALGANQSGRHLLAMNFQKGSYTQFSIGVNSLVWYLKVLMCSSYSLVNTMIVNYILNYKQTKKLSQLGLNQRPFG